MTHKLTLEFETTEELVLFASRLHPEPFSIRFDNLEELASFIENRVMPVAQDIHQENLKKEINKTKPPSVKELNKGVEGYPQPGTPIKGKGTEGQIVVLGKEGPEYEDAPKQKRKRRTKAEMAAARAEEGEDEKATDQSESKAQSKTAKKGKISPLKKGDGAVAERSVAEVTEELGKDTPHQSPDDTAAGEEASQEVSIDQIRDILREIHKRHGKKPAMAVFEEFGIRAIVDAEQKDWPAISAALLEALEEADEEKALAEAEEEDEAEGTEQGTKELGLR